MIASRSAPEFPGSTRIPHESSTTSGSAPALVTTTGVSQAIASAAGKSEPFVQRRHDQDRRPAVEAHQGLLVHLAGKCNPALYADFLHQLGGVLLQRRAFIDDRKPDILGKPGKRLQQEQYSFLMVLGIAHEEYQSALPASPRYC